MLLPHRPAIERRQRSRSCRHVGKAPQPDKAVRIAGSAERADDIHALGFLALDEFSLEQVDQHIALAGFQGVLAQLDDRVHCTLVKSIAQFISQLLPPSGEKACSQWAEAAVIFDQVKRTLIGFPLK